MSLDTVIASLKAAVAELEGAAGAPAAGPLKAYERPEMSADDPDLIKDGVTHNKDGAVWIVPQSSFSPGTPPPGPAAPMPIAYGYYSEKKNPEFFAVLRKIYDTPGGTWPMLELQFKTNPYAIYRTDPKTLVNPDGTHASFITIGGALSPGETFHQD